MTTRLVIVCWLAAACGRVSFDARIDAGGDSGNALVLDPATVTINTGSKVQLTPSGGTPPYVFEVASGGGWVDEAGLFWAPNRVGTSIVGVADAAGMKALTTIDHEGSTIFMAGGLVAGSTITSVYASTDGATWNMVGNLPAPRTNGAMIVYDDRLLYIGGMNGGVPQSTIYASTNGIDWTMIGNLPAAVVSMAATVHEGALYKTGGYDGSSDHADIIRSTDGATWTTIATSFPTPRHEHDLISRGGKLVVFGGHGAINYDDIVESSDDGVTWATASATLTFATDFQGLVELGDTVVRTCGISCTFTEASNDIVTWTQGTMSVARDGPTLVILGGRILLLGGGSPTILESTDGIAWPSAGTLPLTVTRSSAAVFTPR